MRTKIPRLRELRDLLDEELEKEEPNQNILFEINTERISILEDFLGIVE